MTQGFDRFLPPENSHLTHNQYLFVDLETGGLYANKHSILQIAAVITDLDFKIQGYFMSYLKPHPDLTVTKEALAINQINWEDLQNAPGESAVASTLHYFAALGEHKARFAGYNCQFDLEFLSLMWKRQNTNIMPYQVPWLDIYTTAKSKLGNKMGLPNFKLASVAKYFGIDTAKAHDALEDLFMTIEIAKQLKSMPDREDTEINTNLETTKFSLRQAIIQNDILVQVDNNSILKVGTHIEEIAT